MSRYERLASVASVLGLPVATVEAAARESERRADAPRTLGAAIASELRAEGIEPPTEELLSEVAQNDPALLSDVLARVRATPKQPEEA